MIVNVLVFKFMSFAGKNERLNNKKKKKNVLFFFFPNEA